MFWIEFPYFSFRLAEFTPSQSEKAVQAKFAIAAIQTNIDLPRYKWFATIQAQTRGGRSVRWLRAQPCPFLCLVRSVHNRLELGVCLIDFSLEAISFSHHRFKGNRKYVPLIFQSDDCQRVTLTAGTAYVITRRVRWYFGNHQRFAL